MALELTTQAVEAVLPAQDSLIPHTTDWLMIQEQSERGVPLKKVKQKYRTQYRYDKSGTLFMPPLDPTATKEDLEKLGITNK